jgi:glycosyltransferase involved in cell wall biosynthesis
MKVYQIGSADDPYRELYQQARGTPNVAYVGSLSQPELARAMARISIFSYPSTFEEMYCVSAVEAMAAGALVVATDLGALPETTLGYGDLVPYDPKGDRREFTDRYLMRLQKAVEAADESSDALIARCYAQVQAINAGHTWTIRAAEWERKIVSWKAERMAKLGSRTLQTSWNQ